MYIIYMWVCVSCMHLFFYFVLFTKIKQGYDSSF